MSLLDGKPAVEFWKVEEASLLQRLSQIPNQPLHQLDLQIKETVKITTQR